MAMNAYRNYTNNVSAMKSNLEKLSSGYKINRAGDDAAGLAISEKMRAQITGLETAQKNAKDGISLVQTAEGALTEVHDMLNRMVELATQSANGTYDNTTDRAQLQKEVNQLRDEINRIADSANFNGIKLLDGSLNEEKTTIAGEALINLGTEDKAGKFISSKITTGNTNVGKMSTVLHKDAQGSGETTFEVSLNGLSIENIVDKTKGAKIAVTVGGTKIEMDAVTNKDSLTAADLASALAKKTTTAKINGVTYNITANGENLKFTMDKKSVNKSTLAASFTGNFAVTVGITATGSGTLGNNGNVNLSTVNVKEGSPNTGVVLANTFQQTGWGRTDITDGLVLQVGTESYIFALTDDTFDKATAVSNTVQPDGISYKVVDVRDLTDPSSSTAELKNDSNVSLSNALTRLTEVAKDNDMFTVGLQKDDTGPKLTFQEKSTYSGDARLDKINSTTEPNLKGKTLVDQFKVFKGAEFNVTTPTVNVQGKALTLQIGDTAEDFNQLKVNVKDCHTASLGIANIDISNQEGAKAAIGKIKDAINTVSDIRGTLGATQNRLDHTINNLSVMTENIQDAESTIRDVDVAEEMMAYTKNNILIQSAQAMLAQANQIPQGVLQLLG